MFVNGYRVPDGGSGSEVRAVGLATFLFDAASAAPPVKGFGKVVRCGGSQTYTGFMLRIRDQGEGFRARNIALRLRLSRPPGQSLGFRLLPVDRLPPPQTQDPCIAAPSAPRLRAGGREARCSALDGDVDRGGAFKEGAGCMGVGSRCRVGGG